MAGDNEHSPDFNERSDHAMALCQAGDYFEALAIYQALLKEEPENADVMYNIASCYCMLGELTDAKKHLIRAVVFDPGNYNDALKEADFASLHEWLRQNSEMTKGSFPKNQPDAESSPLDTCAMCGAKLTWMNRQALTCFCEKCGKKYEAKMYNRATFSEAIDRHPELTELDIDKMPITKAIGKLSLSVFVASTFCPLAIIIYFAIIIYLSRSGNILYYYYPIVIVIIVILASLGGGHFSNRVFWRTGNILERLRWGRMSHCWWVFGNCGFLMFCLSGMAGWGGLYYKLLRLDPLQSAHELRILGPSVCLRLLAFYLGAVCFGYLCGVVSLLLYNKRDKVTVVEEMRVHKRMQSV